ncbi:MAG: RNA polymerase sigma-70 factor, ECF subfamily [Alphaproteobacteria bacterium]|nr:MAG: RNA polymerase sigma-70 factor ECF subfamily [Caulobacteraceae bacterium]TPW07597.1 MAG: RNA polymerase sigma-70 factor, ECF subfamily [Alphaproteobacteria bacterium]
MTSEPGARDDAALVAAALAGDSRAFTEIMRRHKEAIYRFVRRYVGDADEAYDIVQETFVSAWSALSGFDKTRPLPAWLRRIALNKCRDWSRRRQVRRFFFAAESIDASPREIAAPTPADNADQEALLAALDARLAALPPSLKEVLILTLFEGLSQKEAARVLNVSPKAIETRIYRARQILARQLSLPAND